jgi:hypothetical protein
MPRTYEPLNSALGSSVCIVSGYGLDDRAIEVRFPAKAKGFFLQPLCPDRLWGPPTLLYNRYRRSFPGAIARPGRDANITVKISTGFMIVSHTYNIPTICTERHVKYNYLRFCRSLKFTKSLLSLRHWLSTPLLWSRYKQHNVPIYKRII